MVVVIENNDTLASLVAQRLKRLPPMRETRVRSLGWEDPLEKEMATHSSILAWRIPWTEEPGGLQSTGSQRVRHDWMTLLYLLTLPWLKYEKLSCRHCCVLVAKLCPALYDPMNFSTPGFPVLHCLPEFAQTHVHWVSDAIQPSHPMLPTSLALNLSQHQGLFQ